MHSFRSFQPFNALLSGLLLAISLANAAPSLSSGVENAPRSFNNATNTCVSIANALKNSTASQVFWPLSIQYTTDTEHYMSSSSQIAACSVEPGSAQDVGTVLQIIGSSRTPFAVKGGGHASNPGFSSTTGVQISMARFSEVTLSSAQDTVDIGTGLIWDDVYASLEASGCNCNVVGGRVSGVGVAGFTLGGGYSWKSSQYGLTIDTIQAYELVLPNGTVTTVTESSNSDLFFGLRVRFNNFGIVTKFTLRTFPQTQVWGGAIVYLPTSIDDVKAATAAFFQNVTDPKAAIITEFNTLAGIPVITASLFYDAPTPPAGMFDALVAPAALSKDVSTRSFSSLVLSSPSNSTAGLRGRFHTVSLTGYSADLIDVIWNETQHWGESLGSLLETGTFISYDIEFFTSGVLSHSTTPSAYPPDRSRALLPLNLYFAWLAPTSDSFFESTIEQSAQTITDAADAEGQNIGDAPLYGNYAVDSTSLDRIYGANLPRLQSIKATYDPNSVMDLSGGWRF
ncbi:FAD-binding domain-containing protein [Schizopora paradoxa]|uniref:FAD-binding domain-containing protein n=1 Tax=Schizopora paradoxa TaxID=27342 RepID=A0A0H2RGX1_9AGAM|nr:FAD-binding domain-containing protein [Schizopora paradoxa]